MHAKQGTKTVTEFAKELVQLATQCQFDKNPYTKERAKKDALIFGTSDEKLRQEALAKDFDYNTLIKAALGYDQSRKASGTIRATTIDGVRQLTHTQEEVDNIAARVMAGKYSARRPRGPNQDTLRPKCPNCPPHYRPHNASRCPAQGKACVVQYVKKKNHFAGSPTCQGGNSIRALEANDTPTTYSYDNQSVSNLEVVEIGQISTNNPENKITLHINNKEMQLLYMSTQDVRKPSYLKPNTPKALDKSNQAKPDSDHTVPKNTLPPLVKSQSPYNPVMEQSILPPCCAATQDITTVRG